MLKMRRLVNRWSITVFILFLIIKLLQFLKKLGVRASEDGWRKATRSFLRTEPSKFVLVCFGLNFDNRDKSYIVKELAEFFQQQPVLYWQIEYGRFSAKRIKKDSIDMAHAEYNPEGRLESIIPRLDGVIGFDTLTEEIKAEVIKKIIEFYNKTRDLPDKKRPRVLTNYLLKWLLHHSHYPKETRMQAKSYLNKILSANFIHFEEISKKLDSNTGRFTIPSFTRYKHPAAGLLNIICRFNQESGIDLWVQCHHVAIDGMPLQEVLQELKKKWDIKNRIKFPASLYKNNSTPVLFSTKGGDKSVYAISRVVNFFPLLRSEKTLNRKYILEGRRGVTLLMLVIWKLGNHPTFKGRKFLIPVDIRSYAGHERSLGFVIIRPSIYFNENKIENGFLEFHQEFSRQVKATIFRRSETYELLERYAILPPFLYTLSLRLIPSAVKELIGSFGITVISQAEAFIAPYSDAHSDGFIALSNITVYPKERIASCYVNIKGPKNKLEGYVKAIEEISKSGF